MGRPAITPLWRVLSSRFPWDFLPIVILLAAIFLVCFSHFTPPKEKLNVLFIAIDDLRPELGCYGVPNISTPHFDAFAKRSLLFTRAYCQQAVCNPSRSSLLTGRRPDTTKIVDNTSHFRSVLPDVVTLPQYFKQHGWHTQALGKIYHGDLDDPASWSTPSWRARPSSTSQRQRPAFFASDRPDDELPDGAVAEQAITTLRTLKDRPFFLAVGFYKPHLPLIAPQKYFDLYRLEDMHSPASDKLPEGAPEFASSRNRELHTYANIPKNDPIPPDIARELRRAYYAATSYVDAQLGKVLDELDQLGLRDRTVVVVWGDHGWKLGEHGLWGKTCNWEVDCRVPLLISVPGQQTSGRCCDALVELVDIYPSLVELCGLKSPSGMEGTSFAPLIADPTRKWKTAAFSQFPRLPLTGYAMRTERYRYIEWQRPSDGKVIARELYDYQTDPNEQANMASHPEHAELIEFLAQELRAGWRQAKSPAESP